MSTQCSDCTGTWLAHDDSCGMLKMLEAVLDSDREFFEHNPSASERVRDTTLIESIQSVVAERDGELPEPIRGKHWTAAGSMRVVNLGPGLRARVPLDNSLLYLEDD